MKELIEIQSELEVGKGQYNDFSKYSYRNAEDIEAALKPLKKKYNVSVTTTYDVVLIGERYYIKATSTIRNENGETESVTAFSREPDMKKGMDQSQITGSAESYAHKYALGGLFGIDDTKDADSMDNRQVGAKQTTNGQQNQAKNPLNSKFGAVAKKYQAQHSLTEDEMYKQISTASNATINNFYAFNKLTETQKKWIIDWLSQRLS
ncbi:ERF family protein [Weissella confusa]|uniref:ERF family protein n=1 Tax=Weissella confusa TaxID=1583 RepID=UPI001C6FA19A|nr:ERF family protein [Weissella confusa]QYU58183.1 ERF family protein [Weissella confusa]